MVVVRHVPIVYLKKELYDELIRQGVTVKDFVNDATEEKMKKELVKK